MATRVFINCPFDAEYKNNFLRALIFICAYYEVEPVFTLDLDNNRHHRLDKLYEIINDSMLSIHDLSRCKCQSTQDENKPEYYRLNMPFELGLDFAFSHAYKRDKRILVLENNPYELQKALSDSLGIDPKPYSENIAIFFQIVRDWFFNSRKFEAKKFTHIQLNTKFSEFNTQLIKELGKDHKPEEVNQLLQDMGVPEFKLKVQEFWTG